MQTRLVNLARALIRRPQLLLIDGIMEGMPGLLDRVVDAVRHYQARQGFGVVMTGRHQGIELATRVLELGENGLEPITG
jgi:ABC-type branched-subunit amino acid transport system ATPase component